MFARLEQADEARRRRREHAPLEDLLDHRARLLEDADPRGDVHAEDHPEQPELRRPHRLVHFHVGASSPAPCAGPGTQPAGFQPSAGTRTVNAPNIMKAK